MDPRIYLFHNISVRLSLKVIRKIRRLIDIGVEDIYIYICSDGGSFDAACAIIDEMLGLQSIGITVHTICYSLACSGAADILVLGSHGHRYCTRNSTIMVHPMSYATNEDRAGNVKIMSEHLEKRSDEINSLVCKACGCHTTKKKQDFLGRINKGWWLTSKEAIKYGVVDGYWDYRLEKDIKHIDTTQDTN
jgi:ATP-dependent Clp endopeptidase proteolytic subunit ClpP